ncbi:putative membrane protein [Cryobacterium mesophilum]|uniref:DUF1345 domain-containing protein n=1 Tax=Terrimesophilobacter mesophilus TaxID=433647 RepID=UPI0018286553|nr:DUF1345 domain-containing protein [Terrimesophilobacter mesophilus]MBB5633993.1 putative membrane protein [Terrimesophilobacter mesophilus]
MQSTPPRSSTYTASVRVVAMLIVGLVAAVVTGLFGSWSYSVIAGWIAAAVTYTSWVWIRVGRMGAEETRVHATREDPSKGFADVLLVIASLCSLVIVVFVLIASASLGGAGRAALAGLAIASVALSWVLIHTLFMLRYAFLYYDGTRGGVDFNQKEPPDYGDFAYLAFTIGMTYQVSDTSLGGRDFRVTALRHALLSYLFGAVILATVINFVAGLGG